MLISSSKSVPPGLFQQPVQVPGLQDLPLGQRKTRGLGHLAQRIQFFGGRLFVDAIQQRAAQAFQLLGGGDIGQHHEFLDQLVGVKAVAEIHRLHPPVRGQDDPAFGQVQFQRLTPRPGGFQHAHRRPKAGG